MSSNWGYSPVSNKSNSFLKKYIEFSFWIAHNKGSCSRAGKFWINTLAASNLTKVDSSEIKQFSIMLKVCSSSIDNLPIYSKLEYLISSLSLLFINDSNSSKASFFPTSLLRTYKKIFSGVNWSLIFTLNFPLLLRDDIPSMRSF